MDNQKASLCEESTFSKIFREYSQTLFNFLYYKSGNQNLAQDLTQEAFMKLWQNCQSVLLASAKGYVFKTANNLMINEFKHQKVKLKFQGIKQKQETNETPSFLLEEKELKEQLENAIATLPEKQRVVFLMSRIDKKTYKEIAAILDISRQAVEKRMYNALDKLRKISEKIR